MSFTIVIIPAVICFILIVAFIKKVDILKEFTSGATDGLNTAKALLPTLTLFLTAIGMFRASGALEILTEFISPAAEIFGIPKETLPLMLLKPFSGGGSIALLEDVLTNYGVDSFIGRVAATVAGATETTFYTIAVYYGSVSVSKTRHTVPAALSADITGFILSAFFIQLFFK